MRVLTFVLALLALPACADAPLPAFGGRTPLDFTGPTPEAAPGGSAVATQEGAVAVAACADPADGQLLWLPEDDTDDAAHEAHRIAATPGVKRERDVLVLAPKEGEPLRFTDWYVPAAPDGDGDFVRYRYFGTLAGTGWWRVEVQYGHDAPSSWLVNPATGHAVHVHNGGETTTLSSDGRWLASLDASSSPYRLVLVALGDGAPTLAVDCRFTPGSDDVRPSACGFRGARYEATWEGAGGMTLERTRTGWTLAGQLAALGADCRAPR